MAGVSFSHPNPDIGDLRLRLAPTQVQWQTNLVTNRVPTYAGEVVQVLGINFGDLVISGRFGREGPHGATWHPPVYKRNRKGQRVLVHPGHWTERKDFWPSLPYKYPAKQPLLKGLTQMTQYFRLYFAVASQGGDYADATLTRGMYDQRFMTLSYGGATDDFERHWTVYPKGFPSYRRSNEDYAPEWQVTCQVVEPDFAVRTTEMLKSIARLKQNTGYRVLNPFSDPLADPRLSGKTQAERKLSLDQVNKAVDDWIGGLIPSYSSGDLNSLLNAGASVVGAYNRELRQMANSKASKKKKTKVRTPDGGSTRPNRGSAPGTSPGTNP
jgi:hypothetical protein